PAVRLLVRRADVLLSPLGDHEVSTMRTIVLIAAILPALAFAQKWDATHDLIGRVDFEPVYAVYTQTATKRIPPSWNTKRGYLAISEKGIHFIRRRNKTEEFFVAY